VPIVSSLSALLGKSAQGQPYMIEEASYLCSTRWGSLRREVQTSSQAAHSLGSTC
jgi:hypothetical protein